MESISSSAATAKRENLFIVLKVRDSSQIDSAFEFIGVFDSEEKGLAACLNQQYGIGPAVLNEDLGDARSDWPEFYYPHMMPLLDPLDIAAEPSKKPTE